MSNYGNLIARDTFAPNTADGPARRIIIVVRKFLGKFNEEYSTRYRIRVERAPGDQRLYARRSV